VRRELGFRTLFNLLGPLSNPARVPFMLVGVGDVRFIHRMAEALAATGVERAWVVHGAGGLDELSTAGPNLVLDVAEGSVSERTVDPSSLGLAVAGPDQLRGGDATANAAAVRAVLAGEAGAVRDTVLLNAAAGFVVAGRADDLPDGVQLAAASIDGGGAAGALDLLVAASRGAPADESED
jgi:anthranilate phosphoribosyltransferase